jgi:thiol-disulfide isomerase/thioredoxin
MKPAKLIATAALLGVLAGAAAVYVKGRPSVHEGDGDDVASAGKAVCPLKQQFKDALDKAAIGDVAAMTPANPSKQLGSLAFNGPNNRPMTLADIPGKTVLLNLWATWCVPCREEMPALDALQSKAGNGTFEVVAVNVDADTGEKRKRFLAETGIKTLKDYSEPTLSLFNDLKKEGLALGLPVTMLIGPDGCLIAAMNGPANWGGDDALKLIKTIMEVPST